MANTDVFGGIGSIGGSRSWNPLTSFFQGQHAEQARQLNALAIRDRQMDLDSRLATLADADALANRDPQALGRLTARDPQQGANLVH